MNAAHSQILRCHSADTAIHGAAVLAHARQNGRMDGAQRGWSSWLANAVARMDASPINARRGSAGAIGVDYLKQPA